MEGGRSRSAGRKDWRPHLGENGQYSRHVLDNGLRVVSERIPRVESVSLGIWIETGVKQEEPGWEGTTHFIEHLLFKGTGRRSAREIAEAIDGVGGQLNGFTNREYTCFYARVLADYLPLAMDVLADMVTNPTFDPDELQREKQVVIEEIKRYEDDPEEWVHDLFAQTIWKGHPLGRSLLGREQVIREMDRDKAFAFFHRHYQPGNIIISAAGNVDHDWLAAESERIFGARPGQAQPAPEAPARYQTARQVISRSTEQVHFVLGTPGYSHTSEERYNLAVLDAVLGGGMSSRLFQEVRENRGLVYHIGSYALAYRTSGLFAVSAGVSPDNLDEVLEIVRREMASVRAQGISEQECLRAKEQLKGGMALALENTGYRMRRNGTNEMYWGRAIPFEEVAARINEVTPEQVHRVAQGVLDAEAVNYVAIGPFAGDKE